MKQKKVVALQTTKATETPEFYEREISLTLEQGGYIRLTFLGNNIAGCIAGILNASQGSVRSFNGEIPICVTFRYWQLTADLEDLTVEAGVTDCPDARQNVAVFCSALVARAKVKFAEALARQQITLVGQLGELEAA